MRSLGTIRARVDRLAADWLPSPEPMFICWEQANTLCPSCGADLAEYAQAFALAAAVELRAPDAPLPTFVFYAVDELTMCPRCDTALPRGQ